MAVTSFRLVAIGIGGLIDRIKAVRVQRTLHLRAIHSTMDRIIHNLTPILACIILIGGGAAWIAGDRLAPFTIAGSITLFLFSGITRTWGQTLASIELSDQA
jgi:hypothetical protein